MPLVYQLVRRMLRTALAYFYAEVEVQGAGRVPAEGAAILAANHHISMIDPFLLVATAPRAVRFVAKAPLFRVPLLGFFLRRLRCIPAHRSQDSGYAKGKNDALYEAVGEALAGGGAVGIFPEGLSHDDPALAPFRHGAAKMALDAEAKAGGSLGLKIVPVGIHVEESRLFRGRVLVSYGEPFGLEEYRGRHGEDPRAAIADVTAALRDRVSRLIVEADSEETLRLAGVVEGLTRQDESGSLKEAMERKQFILGRFREIEARRPEAAARIRSLVRRYDRLHDLAGSSAAGFGRTLGLALLGAPFLLAGLAVNAVPYLLSRILGAATTAIARRGADVRAGNGFFAALVCFPAWYAALAWWLPVRVSIPLLVAGPLLGLVALHSLARWKRTWELAGDLLARVASPDLGARRARLRSRILGRIDRLRAT